MRSRNLKEEDPEFKRDKDMDVESWGSKDTHQVRIFFSSAMDPSHITVASKGQSAHPKY